MGAVIIPIKSCSEHLKNPGPAMAENERTLLLSQGHVLLMPGSTFPKIFYNLFVKEATCLFSITVLSKQQGHKSNFIQFYL